MLTFLFSPSNFNAETQIQKSPNAVHSPTQKILQSTITYSIFEQEFMFTNSPEDYQRSFLRLKQRYSLDLSLGVVEKIMFGIGSDKNLFKSDVAVLAKCSQLKIKLRGHLLDIL